MLKATHQGILKIGNMDIPCAVLTDETRVLSKSVILKAFGKTGKKETRNTPDFVYPENLKPLRGLDFTGIFKPIRYQNLRGRMTSGYNAKILPRICEVYLLAKDKVFLTKRHLPRSARCETLLGSIGKVGIISLVDEATEYQYYRVRKTLEGILDKFISKELGKWTKTFPDDFFEEMFRLRGWSYNQFSVKRPSVVGHLTNDVVYERLSPGTLSELKKLTPGNSRNHKKDHNFHHFIRDINHPQLREHLFAVISLMKAFANWGQFHRALQRALPKHKAA